MNKLRKPASTELARSIAWAVIYEAVSQARGVLIKSGMTIDGDEAEGQRIAKLALQFFDKHQESFKSSAELFRDSANEIIGHNVVVDFPNVPECPHPKGRIKGRGRSRHCSDCGQLV